METTEEKIEERQEPKKITKTVKWFNEYCVENKSDIKTICDITSRSIQNQFNMFVKSSNTEVYALIFFQRNKINMIIFHLKYVIQ